MNKLPRTLFLLSSDPPLNTVSELIQRHNLSKIADIKLLLAEDTKVKETVYSYKPEILGVFWPANISRIESILDYCLEDSENKEPYLKWIHMFSTGVDALGNGGSDMNDKKGLSDKLVSSPGVITNAQATMNTELAEWVAFAILWHLKNGQA